MTTLRLCRAPGCRAVCSGCYCDRHAEPATRPDRRQSAAKRGYDRRWRAAARAYLAEHPICERCTKALATDVHHKHKRRDGGSDEAHNLEALCHSCHSRETARGG